jgi:hypothetical protein
VIGMIFATSSKIGGVSDSEHHPHHDDLSQRMSPQLGGVDSGLWQDHLDKSDGQKSSKLVTLIGTMDLAMLKSLFWFIRPSLRSLEEAIR